VDGLDVFGFSESNNPWMIKKFMKENDLRMLVYIAGYGRSGSTILDIILGNHDHIESVGELVNLFHDGMDIKRPCSCGKSFKDCEFWNPILSNLFGKFDTNDFYKMNKLQRDVESLTKLWRIFTGFHSGIAYDRYRGVMTLLFNHIAQASGKPFVVDSSKSSTDHVGRPYAFRKLCGFNVKIIHLVRDGRGVMWSVMRGSNLEMERGTNGKVPFGPYRALMGWLLSNTIVSLLGFFDTGKHYKLVRYEDLIDDPENELRRISSFLGINMDQLITQVRSRSSLKVGHNVGGNRLRLSQKVKLGRDLEWRQKLPVKLRLLFLFVAWPLALKYGYNLFEQ